MLAICSKVENLCIHVSMYCEQVRYAKIYDTDIVYIHRTTYTNLLVWIVRQYLSL